MLALPLIGCEQGGCSDGLVFRVVVWRGGVGGDFGEPGAEPGEGFGLVDAFVFVVRHFGVCGGGYERWDGGGEKAMILTPKRWMFCLAASLVQGPIVDSRR